MGILGYFLVVVTVLGAGAEKRGRGGNDSIIEGWKGSSTKVKKSIQAKMELWEMIV